MTCVNMVYVETNEITNNKYLKIYIQIKWLHCLIIKLKNDDAM
jgi:hypothetical protein